MNIKRSDLLLIYFKISISRILMTHWEEALINREECIFSNPKLILMKAQLQIIINYEYNDMNKLLILTI